MHIIVASKDRNPTPYIYIRIIVLAIMHCVKSSSEKIGTIQMKKGNKNMG